MMKNKEIAAKKALEILFSLGGGDVWEKINQYYKHHYHTFLYY